MANATADYGFAYVRCHLGDPQPIECAALAAASDLYIGDPVKLSGTADSSARPSITVAAAGDTSIFGVVTGVKATGPDNLNKMHSTSADTIIVMPTGPGAIFRVNASGATGTRLDDIGLGFDHVAGTGDTLTGRSGYALDMGEDASAGATTGRQWRVIGFDRRPDNEYSTTVTTDTINVDLLVVCAESFWFTGGAGA